MKKESGPFRFKHFSVSHTKSSIKVGVDGVLVGLWSKIDKADKILDIGTGCGIIALMIAQRIQNRNPIKYDIDAIDIDEPSVMEAEENFRNSPWSKRLKVYKSDLINWKNGESGFYNLIVSNPPFFSSGIEKTDTSRKAARHQKSLPLEILMECVSRLLKQEGIFSLILPMEYAEEATILANHHKLFRTDACKIRGHREAPWKRILLEFTKHNKDEKTQFFPENELTLELSRGIPTEEYRKLGKDFYLNF